MVFAYLGGHAAVLLQLAEKGAGWEVVGAFWHWWNCKIGLCSLTSRKH